MDDNRAGFDPRQNLSSAARAFQLPGERSQTAAPRPCFRDLVLFYVVTGISLRWIATAAAAGPSSIVIWLGAWLVFYIPLALSVIELSSRYPTRAVCMSGANMPLAISLDSCPPGPTGLATCLTSPRCCTLPPATLCSCDRMRGCTSLPRVLLHRVFHPDAVVVAIVNIIGLDVGKWLHNIGAIAMWCR